MKVGFPVATDAGLESGLFGHFGSAPLFIAIDIDTEEISCFVNCDPLAPEAGCNALKSICSRSLDVMIVDGIGDGFLRILHGCGIEVFQAESASVRENLTLFNKKRLSKVEMLNSAEAGRCNSDDDDGSAHTCNHSHDEEE
jgi:predicted Fe-Mo cluster-binding NifX family protein